MAFDIVQLAPMKLFAHCRRHENQCNNGRFFLPPTAKAPAPFCYLTEFEVLAVVPLCHCCFMFVINNHEMPRHLSPPKSSQNE